MKDDVTKGLGGGGLAKVTERGRGSENPKFKMTSFVNAPMVMVLFTNFIIILNRG